MNVFGSLFPCENIPCDCNECVRRFNLRKQRFKNQRDIVMKKKNNEYLRQKQNIRRKQQRKIKKEKSKKYGPTGEIVEISIVSPGEYPLSEPSLSNSPSCMSPKGTLSSSSSEGVNSHTLGTAMSLIRKIVPTIHNNIMQYVDLPKVKAIDKHAPDVCLLCKAFGSKEFLGKGADLVALPCHWSKKIRESAFFKTKCIIKLTIHNLVENISDCAFKKCNIKDIKFGQKDKLVNIGSFAFDGCSGLEEIEIPEGVISIQNSAFAHCKKLKKVILPSTLRDFGNGALPGDPNADVFMECSSLKEVIVKNVETFKAVLAHPKGEYNKCFDGFFGCNNAKYLLPPIPVRTPTGDEYNIEGIRISCWRAEFHDDDEDIVPILFVDIKSVVMAQHGSNVGGKTTFKLMGALKDTTDFTISLDGKRNQKKFFEGLMEYEIRLVYNPIKKRT